MQLLLRIVVFTVLSFTLPIGRLFDLFVWNNSIVRVEHVENCRKITANAVYKHFVKQFKAVKTECLQSFFGINYFVIIEKVKNTQVNQLYKFQNSHHNNFISQVIFQFVFNVQYADELGVNAC